MWILSLIACLSPADPPSIRFVRGGLLVRGAEITGQATAAGTLLPRMWAPNEAVELAGVSAVAPLLPACVPLYHVPLGDVSRLVVGGGAAPDTALAFSPDGALLAAGALTGSLVVVDGWTGVELARQRRSEGAVKWLDFSPDGATLYVIEQSPDALLLALDPHSLDLRWSLRLADYVGSSALPDVDDLYGVYTLPSGSAEVQPDGSLWLVASHGWNLDGVRHNRSLLLHVGADGGVLAQWPDAPADAIFRHPVVSEGWIALTIGRSSPGPAPKDLAVGGVQLLRTGPLRSVAQVRYPALEPWFHQPFVWEAVDLDPAANELVAAMADGRVIATDLQGTPRWRWDASTPILAGDIPLYASIGQLVRAGADRVVLSSATHIPYGAASPELAPPQAHPRENTVFVRREGALRWAWSGPYALQGLTVDGRSLIVGAGQRADGRHDLYGAVVLDLDASSADSRLQTVCHTAGPVFFRQAVDRDRVAVAEYPYRQDGVPVGDYQVTVFR